MLLHLPTLVQKFDLQIRGVIHIGAHFGEELDDYEKLGIQKMVFIEPCGRAFAKLKARVLQKQDALCINAACGPSFGRIQMHTETKNNGQSNSVLKPKQHLEHYPDIVFEGSEQVDMIPLDDLPISKELYNMINIDVQGFEGEVFKGGVKTLSRHIDYIYTEVNTAELYENCTLLPDLDKFLGDLGFQRVITKMTGQNWGDALYIKKHEP